MSLYAVYIAVLFSQLQVLLQEPQLDNWVFNPNVTVWANAELYFVR